jgi:hypothetical protein
MKLKLDSEELLALIVKALADEGFSHNVTDVRIDLGDATIPLDAVHGLIVEISKP